MELSDKIDVLHDKKPTLVEGGTYGVIINNCRYEGTYEGLKQGRIILRTGTIYGKRGTALFERKEFKAELEEKFYPL